MGISDVEPSVGRVAESQLAGAEVRDGLSFELTRAGTVAAPCNDSAASSCGSSYAVSLTILEALWESHRYPITTAWRVARPAHKVKRALELVGCDNLMVNCAGLLLSLTSFLASGWDPGPAEPHRYRTKDILCLSCAVHNAGEAVGLRST